MWEYKITRSDLGYNIYRKKELKDGTMRMERLQRDTYTLKREFARTFYHLNDAMSALVVERSKQGDKTPTTSKKKSESEGKGERTSWSELS